MPSSMRYRAGSPSLSQSASIFRPTRAFCCIPVPIPHRGCSFRVMAKGGSSSRISPNRLRVSSIPNRSWIPSIASGPTTYASAAASRATPTARRAARDSSPPLQITSAIVPIARTTGLRDPVVGMTVTVAAVLAMARNRTFLRLAFRPNDRSKAGTRTAKSAKPEMYENVDDTRARPVVATVAIGTISSPLYRA